MGVGTTHHVRLGGVDLIIRPNSFTKSAAPTFGARISTGDPDYNNLSIWQHWVQKCWVGGMGEDEWVDDAMYDTATGLDTTRHEGLRLARQLKRGSGSNWAMGGSTGVEGYKFHVHNNRLYCLVTVSGADSRLYVYTQGTESWAGVTMPGAEFYARCIVSFDGKLLVGGVNKTPNPDVPAIYYATTPGSWTTMTNPTGFLSTVGVTAMKVYNRKLYCSYGTQIFRMNDDQTWDGTTVFYKTNATGDSNYVSAMEVHLGFLYMLSQNGHLHRTDGNNTFDIWSWDGQTNGVSLRSYDGKLFVGTYEWADTTDIGYGVLYQFTGAAVTELKRWGRDTKATSIGNMMVYGRRLYYGASSLLGVRNGFGVAVYDAVEDAHSIFAINDDTATYADSTGVGTHWLVDDVIVFAGKLFCTARTHGVFFTEDTFQDVRLNRAQFTTSTTGGVLTSSTYDAGTPGLLKLWRKAVVHCTVPANTSIRFHYSTNGGTTWTDTATQSGPSPSSGRYTFFFENVRSTQFTYKLTLKSTDETVSPSVRAVVISYLPQPEPNWQWTFTVPFADKWLLLDGTEETLDANDLINFFAAKFRDQLLVTFTEPNGTVWNSTGHGVLIYDMSIVYYDIDVPGGGLEGDIRFTLLEVVEAY